MQYQLLNQLRLQIFHCAETFACSIKKNAVAANIPIEINQNEIPTKSSVAKKVVAALAAVVAPISTKAKANIFIVFIKTPSLVSFYSLNLTTAEPNGSTRVRGLITKKIDYWRLKTFKKYWFYLYFKIKYNLLLKINKNKNQNKLIWNIILKKFMRFS